MSKEHFEPLNTGIGSAGEHRRGQNNKPRGRRVFTGNNLEPITLSSGSEHHDSEQSLFSDESQESKSPKQFSRHTRRRSTMGDKYEVLRNAFNSGLDGGDSSKLHAVIKSSKDVFNASTFLTEIAYQGFNRNVFIKAALTKMTPHELLQFAILGAVRGTNFEKIVMNTPSIPISMKNAYKANFTKKANKSDDITISRCSASIPQWVAYFMIGIEKRFADLDCPSCLQFPAAGALPMSREIRIAHINFSMRFSAVIGGKFDDNIYKAMMQNVLPMSEVPEELKAYLGLVDSEINSDTGLIEIARGQKALT